MKTQPLSPSRKNCPGTSFVSILFATYEDSRLAEDAVRPDHFADLNLDQVVQEATVGRDGYELASFFDYPLQSISSIEFRHNVFRDLSQSEVKEAVQKFSAEMEKSRQRLAQARKVYNQRQRDRWFLSAVVGYCASVRELSTNFNQLDVRSRGFESVAAYLRDYVASDDFAELSAEANELDDQFSHMKFNVFIKSNKITVTPFGGEVDFGEEVNATFERFRRGESKEYRVKFPDWPELNPVEAQVLEVVARMNPHVFARAADFRVRRREFLDATIARFDREVQFYLTYLDLMKRHEALGLSFCYPVVSEGSKELNVRGAFDLALSLLLAKEGIVAKRNSYFLAASERVIVVSGPNSGGKTTFARSVGQISYLASLGCPVPAMSANLFLFDRIFTHFEREENLDNLRGKLEEELVRIHQVLEAATERSLIIMNESFASTTLYDQRILGAAVLREIIDLGATAVFVTFVDELSRISTATVSMVALVLPDDPTVRTFEVVRKPADGLAYAVALAERYRLTYDTVKGRIAR